MGKRPAVVISPKEYNEKTGLGLFCPITSKINNPALKGGVLNPFGTNKKLSI
jgi:mRNA-degrading endonuclease toxin of MazEF toxin-antitoxin module